MTLAVGLITFYGVFTLIGGIIGFVKAKSRASLIAGSVSGVALLVCAALMQRGSRPAAIAGLVIAVALGVRFLRTWREKRRVMPDLLMVVLSILSLVIVGATLLSGTHPF